MPTSKTCKVGKTVLMTLTTEMLSVLGVKAGDILHVAYHSDGSLRIRADDGASKTEIEVGEAVMDENEELLARLR